MLKLNIRLSIKPNMFENPTLKLNKEALKNLCLQSVYSF